MQIHLIIVRTGVRDTDEPWTTNAFDEYTMEENPSAFTDALKAERQSHGAANVAVAIITVPDDMMRRAFEPRVTKALDVSFSTEKE
jgi:hypothetical protein